MYNIKHLLNEELILHEKKYLLNEQSLILINNSEYIKHVMGINIPINEIYSFELRKQILEEQILYEDLISSINKYIGTQIEKGKEKTLEVVDSIKTLKDIAKFFKDILVDPELMKTAINSINISIKKLITDITNNVNEILSKIKVDTSGINNKITKLFQHIQNVVTNLSTDGGWKGFLGMLGFSILLTYIQKNFVSFIMKLGGKAGEYLTSFFDSVTSVLNSFDDFKNLVIKSFDITPIITWISKIGTTAITSAVGATGVGTVVAAFNKTTDIINFIGEILNPIMKSVYWATKLRKKVPIQ
jgi:hypothetical protein